MASYAHQDESVVGYYLEPKPSLSLFNCLTGILFGARLSVSYLVAQYYHKHTHQKCDVDCRKRLLSDKSSIRSKLDQSAITCRDSTSPAERT